MFDIVNDGTNQDKDKAIGLVTYTTYEAGEDLTYAYSLDLDVILLMISYGMAFENSKFANIANNAPNLFNTQITDETLRKLCLILSCLDHVALENYNPPASLSKHVNLTSITQITKKDY